MSHKPPNGPPPPYSYSYVYPSSSYVQRPAAVPSYSYVQTPVMMPIPIPVQQTYQPPAPQPPPVHTPQPTHVTNYVYQPVQPEPIKVEAAVEWATTTASTASALAHKAFIGGNVGDNPLWVIRAYHCGDLVPGKFSVNTSSAFIPHGQKEVPVHNFEVLLAQPHTLHWLPSNHGQVPLGAFPAGNTSQGEPLYIGRAKHSRLLASYQTSTIPGKVHPSHGCCYISSAGSEVAYKNYEVLCKVPS